MGNLLASKWYLRSQTILVVHQKQQHIITGEPPYWLPGGSCATIQCWHYFKDSNTSS